MRKLPLFLLLILPNLFFSCSKDIRHTNKIHGTWELTNLQEYNSDGSFETDPEGVFQFDKCQVHEDDFRAFRQQYAYNTGDSTVAKNETGKYKFDEEGRLLIIQIPTNEGVRETVYHLVSLKYRQLIIEHTTPSGLRTIITLKKQ